MNTETQKALKAYLDAKEDKRTAPYTLQRLWMAYTASVEADMRCKANFEPERAQSDSGVL